MKTFGHRLRGRAFTLMEMLLVIAIIVIVAAVLLPAITKGKVRARQAHCASNLKEIGSAFHAFAHEHNSRFPHDVSIHEGGILELWRQRADVYRIFQALSNELVTPKMVVCPADSGRVVAQSFDRMSNDNISYTACDPKYEEPQRLLSCDWNLIFPEDMGSDLRGHWTEDVHQGRGNVLFCDGHVEILVGVTPRFIRVQSPGPPSSRQVASAASQSNASAPVGHSDAGGSSDGSAATVQGDGLTTSYRGRATAPGQPTGDTATAGGGLFSQVENALERRAGGQSWPRFGEATFRADALIRTQEVVGVAKTPLMTYTVTSRETTVTIETVSETSTEGSREVTPLIAGYLEPTDARNLWPVLLLLLVLLFTAELLRRHRHRSKRRFDQG